jgi:mannose-6-phosphate isomerase-like protein (cupin superfamily)
MSMSDSPYTVVNLKEVEDLAAKLGVAPNLESRFAREALELEKSGLTYFRIGPGFRVPFGHRHEQQEEVYLVVSGSVRMKLDEEIRELGAWDAIRVAPQIARGIEAGPNGAEVVAFGAPKVKDSEMLPDFWPS